MLDRFWNRGTDLWSPFSELDRMRREMDRLFQELVASPAFAFSRAGVFPPVNVTQDKDNYYIRAELPGVKPEDLEVTANRNTVSIAGKRYHPREEKASYHRCERPEGEFRRSLSLPTDINAGKVEARYVNGVLTVTVPKAEENKPKQISVNVG